MKFRFGDGRDWFFEKRFNPVRYDPDSWLDFAEEHGIEYLCMTAKHIDGFSMWDARQSDYKVTSTPYGKDTLGLLAEACHRRGFPLCIYYSTIDNDHPAYPHGGNPYEKGHPEPGDSAETGVYLEFVRAQIE